MKEEDINKLKDIKSQITEGVYQILQETKWEENVSNLSNYGASLLNDIENTRDKVRRIRIPPLFFRVKKLLQTTNSEYDEIAKNYDLFFDASMRFLKCMLNGDKYNDRQNYMRKYLEKLVDHCKESSSYLGNLISSNRNDYINSRTFFWTVVAIFVAVSSVLINFLK